MPYLSLQEGPFMLHSKVKVTLDSLSGCICMRWCTLVQRGVRFKLQQQAGGTAGQHEWLSTSLDLHELIRQQLPYTSDG